MLESIKSPKDIKSLSVADTEKLSSEIREKIISAVSKNGGHLGSNLGIVELTVVLHQLFDVPQDKIIFDVGHQAYTHKLLTGRYDEFDTLRQDGGISGFTNRFESEYDTLTAGHSGSSVSAALGIAYANKMSGNDNYVVAVAGDGAFTNGMIYEALNNCNNKNVRLIIILNDNEMSISNNVGSLAKYLSKIRTSGRYYRLKRSFQHVFIKVPVIGKASIDFVRHIKNGLKRAFYKQPFFEPLGVKYLGPVDGSDIERLKVVIGEAKKLDTCSLIHVKTVKGKGYEYAMQDPEIYHSVGKFDPEKGVCLSNGNDFSGEFGRILCALSEKDERICAITAAMKDGTGLSEFAEKFPKRFFDVGIAEEHEIAFAGGLAVAGYLPVCAVYSTFAQRAYDQLIHDVSLQQLHIVLALDRSGLVPCDGITHQGIFDCAFISTIPNTEIYSPDSFGELRTALEKSVSSDKISAVRYPKGAPKEYDRSAFIDCGGYSYCDVYAHEGNADAVIITYGRITANVYGAAVKLKESGKNIRIIKLFKVHPVSDVIDEDFIKLALAAKHVFIYEEGTRSGGVGEKAALILRSAPGAKSDIVIRAIDGYPPHGSEEYLMKMYGLDRDSIAEYLGGVLEKE